MTNDRQKRHRGYSDNRVTDLAECPIEVWRNVITCLRYPILVRLVSKKWSNLVIEEHGNEIFWKPLMKISPEVGIGLQTGVFEAFQVELGKIIPAYHVSTHEGFCFSRFKLYACIYSYPYCGKMVLSCEGDCHISQGGELYMGHVKKSETYIPIDHPTNHSYLDISMMGEMAVFIQDTITLRKVKVYSGKVNISDTRKDFHDHMYKDPDENMCVGVCFRIVGKDAHLITPNGICNRVKADFVMASPWKRTGTVADHKYVLVDVDYCESQEASPIWMSLGTDQHSTIQTILKLFS